MGKFEAFSELGPLGWVLAVVVFLAPKLVMPFILVYLIRRFKFLQRIKFLQYFIKKKGNVQEGEPV